MDPVRRRLGIGGSDISALIGEDPFKDESDVYVSKIAEPETIAEPEPQVDDERAEGHVFESAIITLAARRFNLTVTPNVMIQHPECAIALGTADALGEKVGVEAKHVTQFSPLHFGESIESVPSHFALQCYWYMGVSGRESWILAVHDRGTMRYYEFRADPELFAVLRRIAVRWWDMHIVGGVPVELTSSDLSRRWLQRTYPQHKRPDLRFAQESELELLNEYLWNRINGADLKRRKEDLEVQLQQLIANREGIKWVDGQVTWRKMKDRNITDWESMARGLMNQFMLPTEREDLIKFYTRTKEGSRRFLLTSKFLKEREEEAA